MKGTSTKLRNVFKKHGIRLSKPPFGEEYGFVAAVESNDTYLLFAWEWTDRPGNAKGRHCAFLRAQTEASKLKSLDAIGEGFVGVQPDGEYGPGLDRTMASGKIMRRAFWWKSQLNDLTREAVRVEKARLRRSSCDVCSDVLCDTKHAATKEQIRVAKSLGLDTDRVELVRTGHPNERYDVRVGWKHGWWKVGAVSRRANMPNSWQARSSDSLLGDYREYRDATAVILHDQANDIREFEEKS